MAEPAVTARKFTFEIGETTLKNLIAELGKQTGLEVDISGVDAAKMVEATYKNADFWTVVESVAKQTGSRIAVGMQGKPVRLVKNPSTVTPHSYCDGPFRVVATAVESRVELLSGRRSYDFSLEIAWEARLPVYRIDSRPKLEAGKDDRGRSISVKPVESRAPVSGVFATLRIPLDGLERESKTIEVLRGTFQVTTANEMLRFEFNDLSKPEVKKDKGVEVALKKFAQEGTFWIADIQLRYPPGGAVFESFETYWLGRNRLTLVPPNGAMKLTSTDEEINGNAIRYRFKEDKVKGLTPAMLTGWKLEYETPGVLREVPLRFEFKGIALP